MILISYEVQSTNAKRKSRSFTAVTPAKAGVQWCGRLDSGLRRNDELNIVANQEEV